MTATDVISGRSLWSVEQADCCEWLRSLPADSIDLLLCSPPYEAARTYSIGFNLHGEKWVEWMVDVVIAAAPAVKGLIAIVCEGQTRGYRYSCTPFLLMADLHRRGFVLRKPPIYHRNGTPGAGGPDWLRNEYESVICITRTGKLPWSCNTAMGRPSKYRKSNGTRVNRQRSTFRVPMSNGDVMREELYTPPRHRQPRQRHPLQYRRRALQ